jgi:glycosyltransferase involved in cell wall biosynthesis
MPVYKPNLLWLKEAMYSLNTQTYGDWKLVLSLDGYDPDTLIAGEVAANILKDCQKLVVVRGPRSGISGALNRGLEACNTKYVARLDADDICRPSRLELQLQLMENDSSLIACGTQIRGIDSTGNPLSTKLYSYPRNPMMTLLVGAIFNTPIAHPVLMFRTKQALKIGGYRPLPCMEDYDLISRLSLRGNITNLSGFGLNYRVHNAQHSRQVRPLRSHLLKARCRFIVALLKKQPAASCLIILPLLLYAIGPLGEYRLRRLIRNLTTK